MEDRLRIGGRLEDCGAGLLEGGTDAFDGDIEGAEAEKDRAVAGSGSLSRISVTSKPSC